MALCAEGHCTLIPPRLSRVLSYERAISTAAKYHAFLSKAIARGNDKKLPLTYPSQPPLPSPPPRAPVAAGRCTLPHYIRAPLGTSSVPPPTARLAQPEPDADGDGRRSTAAAASGNAWPSPRGRAAPVRPRGRRWLRRRGTGHVHPGGAAATGTGASAPGSPAAGKRGLRYVGGYGRRGGVRVCVLVFDARRIQTDM